MTLNDALFFLPALLLIQQPQVDSISCVYDRLGAASEALARSTVERSDREATRALLDRFGEASNACISEQSWTPAQNLAARQYALGTALRLVARSELANYRAPEDFVERLADRLEQAGVPTVEADDDGSFGRIIFATLASRIPNWNSLSTEQRRRLGMWAGAGINGLRYMQAGRRAF